MNQELTYIFEAVKDLNNRIQELQATIKSQHHEICTLNRQIDYLKHENRKLKKENEELRTKLTEHESLDKNSQNSNTPPSKENLKAEVIRRTKTLRKQTGKKVGGQKGHKGCTLQSSSTPDETIDIFPDYCTKCGSPLEDGERVLDYITQVVSIPELKPVIRNIRHYITICKQCGERVQSHAPKKRGSNSVVYDSSVKALVLYLNVVLFLPYGRIQDFFKEVFSMNISQGSFVNWVNKAKKKAEPAIEKIKQFIMKSHVVGFDESGLYCNKKLDWAWIAQTVYFTLLFHGKGRSSKELEKRFGDSFERMVAVTDRHNAYFVVNFFNHQVCLAHLLRELQFLNELDKNQQWSRDVEQLLQKAIHERNQNLTSIINKKPWLEKLDELLQENLESLKDNFKSFQKGLIKHREYIFNFLENPEIPSDNNASERGIRKVKIKMKNSGTFRSDEGADAFLSLLSIVETCKKHNKSPLKSLYALFQA